MYERKGFWLRAIAYAAVVAVASLMIAFILIAIFGEGVLERVAAAFAALACLVAGRYISGQVWGKRGVAK